ncbi:MAG TPA: glycosyltransferase family 39 protein [Terriglobales bacterium]|nr:glycosyltransferase family 39 protein [Terriglobales bacterium]
MGTTSAVQAAGWRSDRVSAMALFVLLGAGFLLRLRLAWMTFLNPDEALHYYLAQQPSLKLAYEASLTTAHPPLMILFLHCWSVLGKPELWLRLPFVVAGTLFCWVMFLWIRQVGTSCAAWFALALFTFSPPLISLSAELRQYAFLLLFCSSALCFLERALKESSAVWMLFSAITLWLALLTHYSALIFAAVIGVYALIRILRTKLAALPITAWIFGQAIALAICAFLYESQISKLRQMGLPSEIAATWLRSSIFQPGHDHFLTFAWSKSVRLFRYFFSNGTVGLLGICLFLFALLSILLSSERRQRHALGTLLLLPLLIALGAAIAAVYPYGGTRHDVLLAIFVVPAISIGLDHIPILSKWLKASFVVCALLIGNFRPSPTGPYIRPRNQRREFMQQATTSLRSLPANSVIFTDDQGSMVLNYYLCGESMPLPFYSQKQSFLALRCGDHDVIVATGTQAGFDRTKFPDELAGAWKQVPEAAALDVFQSGWIDDREEEWLGELRALGGSPQSFGPNVLICRMERPYSLR